MTVVVTHRVKPEDVDDFLAWQDRLRLAESKFDGFRGSEFFRPIEGVQDEWTALYRYATAENLDTWLKSDERQKLLAEGNKFSDFQLRTVDNSFGSWFAFDGDGVEAAPPSDTRTSIAVWAGLYPTVVILTLAVSPLHMPLWLGLLVGNLFSSFAMTFLTMPFYVNPLLKRWIRPPADAPRARTILAWRRHCRRAQPVLGGGLLPGDQGVLAPSLARPASGAAAATPGITGSAATCFGATVFASGADAPGCTYGPLDRPESFPPPKDLPHKSCWWWPPSPRGGAGERFERCDLGVLDVFIVMVRVVKVHVRLPVEP